MRPTLSHQAIPSEDVLSQPVGDETVLLDLASERYFGLNPVGTRIWALLSRNPRLQDAFEALCSEYDIDRARLETDLLDLVAQLAEAKLVRLMER